MTKEKVVQFPMDKWGDRGDLNPRPLVPQTTAPCQASRVSGTFRPSTNTTDAESFSICPVHLFKVNRGALVLFPQARA